MPSTCGVEWSGTSSGKLDESAIPDPPDHKSHYLNAADTKSDSSFPVVDGEGNVRAGNVNAAWDLRNQGEGVSEECLRNLDDAFDDNVLPDTAYENSEFAADPPEFEEGMMVEWVVFDAVGQIAHMPDDQNILMVDVMEDGDDGMESTGYTLTAGYPDVQPMDDDMAAEMSEFSGLVSLSGGSEFSQHQLPTDALSDGFNQYGVRQNEDGSIDVRFAVMEPGTRKGVEVTEDFLREVANKNYSTLPLQLDHSDSQRANVGYVDPSNIKFSDGMLRAQVHIPNTGSDVRADVISDFTHEPPQIRDISPGFDPRTLETTRSSDGNPKFADGRLREFSLTPFPAGYDNGGITPEFSEAGVDVDADPDDTDESDPTSYLVRNAHKLIRK